jgi:adenine-specific DNA-methyltransferase
MTTSCTAILKTGSRKGQACGLKATNGSFCGRHTHKPDTCSPTEPIINEDDNQTESGLDERVYLGQFFTISDQLQQCVFDFVKNKTSLILEPSFGKGHLIKKFLENDPNRQMLLHEIDKTIVPFVQLNENQRVVYGDFLVASEMPHCEVIVANPPFNRATEFLAKCYSLLANGGEMVFIVPSRFLKKTSCAKLITTMASNGSFTHFWFPNDERLFEDASIDVVVFRYEKQPVVNDLPRKALVNNEEMFCFTDKGIITFDKEDISLKKRFCDLFHVGVGSVSGRDEIYKQSFGNVRMLVEENTYEQYVLVDKFPHGDNQIDNHLLANKSELLSRGGCNFGENNWWRWTRPIPNREIIDANFNKPCIFVRNLVRNKPVAFIGKVSYFCKSIICLIPRANENTDLEQVIAYLNSEVFQANYRYSGRFMIGQQHLANATL